MCSELSLKSNPSFAMEEIYSALGVVSQRPRSDRLLPEEAGVQLSADPDGPAMAEITATSEYDSSVEVVQQAGARSRILWSSGRAIYFGWVDTAALSIPLGEPGQIIGWPGAPSPSSLRPGPSIRCPTDVPLSVEAEGMVEEVGVIRRGTLFGINQQLADRTSVALASNSYLLQPGSKWFVPTPALAGCVAEQSGSNQRP